MCSKPNSRQTPVPACEGQNTPLYLAFQKQLPALGLQLVGSLLSSAVGITGLVREEGNAGMEEQGCGHVRGHSYMMLSELTLTVGMCMPEAETGGRPEGGV